MKELGYRFSVLDMVTTGLEMVVFFGTAKVIAYRYHGHPIAQAWLTLF